MSENKKDWTVLIYFAADNDLEGKAFQNLFQLTQVGSTDKVHVLAQVDGQSQATRRYFMRAPNDAVVEEVTKKVDGIPTNEINTGSVEDLLDFVRWGSSGDHKAENYFLILWGHGSGIDDDEDDVGTAILKSFMRGSSTVRAEIKLVSAESPRIMATLGTHPGATIADVENLIEDGNPGPVPRPGNILGPIPETDALTCFELQNAFERIEKEIIEKKVAIFGMDACLMSMAEIARQVSDNVQLMVASEEVIPDKSWPYDRILRKLIGKTDSPMTPEQLATVVVDEYCNFYKPDPDPVTLSVCELSKTEDLVRAIHDLARALEELIEEGELRKAVTRARRKTQAFRFRDYIDLHHFCENLQGALNKLRFKAAVDKASPQVDAVREACQKVMDTIKGKNGNGTGFVIHHAHTSGAGGALDNARGVSIYFPPVPPTYADLALCKESQWNTFLFDYINAVFRPDMPTKSLATVFLSAPSGGESGNASAAIAAPTNDHDLNTEGGVFFMSNNMTEDKKPRILLPKGAQIIEPSGAVNTLDAQAFLLLGEAAKIKVPENTELDIPAKGKVKASTGTSTKATSGTRTSSISGVEITVPQCTLSLSFSGGGTAELSDGTKIKSPANGDPFVVLDVLNFEASN